MKDYCMQCGYANEYSAGAKPKKCKKCGSFLSDPIVTAPLQKVTSDVIYKTVRTKASTPIVNEDSEFQEPLDIRPEDIITVDELSKMLSETVANRSYNLRDVMRDSRQK